MAKISSAHEKYLEEHLERLYHISQSIRNQAANKTMSDEEVAALRVLRNELIAVQEKIVSLGMNEFNSLAKLLCIPTEHDGNYY